MMKAVRGEPPSSRGGSQSSVMESGVTLPARSLPDGGPGFSVKHTMVFNLLLPVQQSPSPNTDSQFASLGMNVQPKKSLKSFGDHLKESVISPELHNFSFADLVQFSPLAGQHDRLFFVVFLCKLLTSNDTSWVNSGARNNNTVECLTGSSPASHRSI